jgi:5-methylcytosine-specific restriction endonuclease McrA
LPRNKISEDLQEQVRQRANGLCEYCHASEQWQYVRFTVDHVVPLAEGGGDSLSNLALACFHCNRRKSNHLIGIDPQFGTKVLCSILEAIAGVIISFGLWMDF